jgi:hypothetical protein
MTAARRLRARANRLRYHTTDVMEPSKPAAVIARERTAIAAHRATLRGSELPPPDGAPRGTFLHGFLLPFSLIVATLRDADLRRPYLRLAAVRLAVAVAAALLLFSSDKAKPRRDRSGPTIVVHGDASGRPVKVDVPGVHVEIDERKGKEEVTVLGQEIPVEHAERGARAEPPAAQAPPTRAGRAWVALRDGWAWILALVAFFSVVEGVIVFFSRRWDDWLSFHLSRIAGIKPEDEAPKDPKIALDLKWLYKKMKRRIRGYVVFAAGVPALVPLRLVPSVGPWLFSAALTAWAWYWLGVFAASKSAHAWADEGTAPSPAPIRFLNERVATRWWAAPLRPYGKLWAFFTRGVNPPAATFERSPAAFLGLALARTVLSLPGLYFLARPVVPVAAGRLCAESDPADRFTVKPAGGPPPAQAAHAAA